MRGLRNNNPLNIRHSKDKWQGIATTQTDKEFVQFQSMAHGYRAVWRTLYTYYKRLRERKKHFTVENIIHRWAPPEENDVDAYVKTVLNITSLGGNERLPRPFTGYQLENFFYKENAYQKTKNRVFYCKAKDQGKLCRFICQRIQDLSEV